MSLSNYSELQTSVAGWLNRSDLTSVIPDFVALCEADMNRRLRCPENEEMDTAFSVTGRYTALPSDFAEMRRVILNDSVRTKLDPLPTAGGLYESGEPRFYNIIDSTIEIVPLSTAYTLELSYWEKVPALATNSTNNVLTAYPDLYLLGSLMWAGHYLDDPGVIARWEPKYERALEKANAKRFRNYGTGLQVRAG